jgi:beta-glucanase (GH16 family)
MKLKAWLPLLMIAALVFSCAKKAEPAPESKTGPDGRQWKLVWNDEFDVDGAPDPAKWTYDTGGHGWGNQELQNYTMERANSFVKKGHLSIKAIREGKNRWTSARLKTKGIASWTGGRFEIRARMPGGKGTWTALWLHPEKESYGPWPKSGEIDLMEYVGYLPGRIHGTVHTEAFNHMNGTHQQGKDIREDAEKAFHVYAAEWDEEQIRFYIDDEEYFYFDNEHLTPAEWPFDQPFYLIMNLSIGGTWGAKEGVDKQMNEALLLVDYVRVYEQVK